MIDTVRPTSIQSTARTAGLLYLILAVCGGFAEFFVRQSLIVRGDAAATATNILAAQPLFRLGIVSELVGQVAFVLLVLALYRVLEPIGRFHARAMVAFVLVAVTITCLNMLNQFAALYLLSGGNHLAVFDAGQLDALVLSFLDLHQAGYLIAQVFFGLWLLPLGYLIVRSGFIPRVIGVLLMIACFGYLTDVATFFLAPGFGVSVSEFTFVGELLLMIWLLVRGVDAAAWNERATRTRAALG
ncbi:MAG: DUF4386 domain-containing protein [Deinococcales bacterium]